MNKRKSLIKVCLL